MRFQESNFPPFSEAENDTLQVLPDHFSVERVGGGSRLNVRFGPQTPTIRRRESRLKLRRLMEKEIPNFLSRCKELQEQIDAILLDGTSDGFVHEDPAFRFRYCSGGTLPVLTLSGEDYYCLFLRDIPPIGWNIANGSTDTFRELLDPSIAIRRELREELIVVDPSRGVDYTFVWDTEHLVNRPEFDDARRMVSDDVPGFAAILRYHKAPQVVRTADGPDSVAASYLDARGEETRLSAPVGGCFLSVTAEDFGIEIDHVGRAELPEGVCLLDGEINGNRLLNRPIGLFRVRDFDPTPPVLPSKVFHFGGPSTLSAAIGAFCGYVQDSGIRNKKHLNEWRNISASERLRLCPVTSLIIRRHQLYLHAPRPGYVHEQSMLAYMFDLCARADQLFRPTTFHDFGIDGEIEWVDNAGTVSGRRIYVQLKSGKAQISRKADGTEVFRIKSERHIQYWRDQDSDVYLVVRTEKDGEVRWMNISQALRNNPTATVHFTGTRLDRSSLLETRDRCLSARR